MNGEGRSHDRSLAASLVSTDFYPNIVSRFEYLNPAEHFRFTKNAHGFAKGDVIAITSAGALEKANASTISRTIGVVSYTGPILINLK